jgi:hypothetical protein
LQVQGQPGLHVKTLSQKSKHARRCNPSYLGNWDQEEHGSTSAWANSSRDPHLPNNQSKMDWSCGSTVVRLLCKCKTLSSNPRPTPHTKSKQNKTNQNNNTEKITILRAPWGSFLCASACVGGTPSRTGECLLPRAPVSCPGKHPAKSPSFWAPPAWIDYTDKPASNGIIMACFPLCLTFHEALRVWYSLTASSKPILFYCFVLFHCMSGQQVAHFYSLWHI